MINVGLVQSSAAITEVNNVPVYMAKLSFDNNDPRIKSGMVANIKVYGDEHDNVLLIPSSAVITEDTGKFVLVPDGSKTKEQQVQLGISGGGNVEVTSGLNENDRIVNFGK